MRMGERNARLVGAIRALKPKSRPEPPATDHDARLEHLEEDVREVRTRVNALFFTVISVALGDLVSRLMLS